MPVLRLALLAVRFALPFGVLAAATAPAAQTALPFTVEVVEVVQANAPALHSSAYAQHGGRWLFVTGRTNGLHGLTANPDPFPAAFAHGAVVVYDLAADTRWTASLDELPAAVAAPLRAANAEFWQEGTTLYVIGGYGRDATDAQVTFPTLTAVDVPGLIGGRIMGRPSRRTSASSPTRGWPSPAATSSAPPGATTSWAATATTARTSPPAPCRSTPRPSAPSRSPTTGRRSPSPTTPR